MTEIKNLKNTKGQWPKAAKFWPNIGPPLRPIHEDLQFIRNELEIYSDTPLNALILGVTPEYYNLPWPKSSYVQALDCTAEMIDFVWPGPKENAILGDWRSIPLPSGQTDIVLCDGGLLLLDFPQGHEKMASELARILKPGGLAIFRIFTQPAEPESPGDVISDLMNHRIRDLNCLKIRLGNAMQENTDSGIELSKIWNMLRNNTSDWESLSKYLGWPLETLEAINAYQNNPAIYHFLTAEQADELFAKHGLKCSQRFIPEYQMGLQCPTHFYRKRS
jgi:SAM-dependent methyltransferase